MDYENNLQDALAVQGRMKDIRRQKKLTYDKLQELTGIPHATLHRYFNGNPYKIPLNAITTISKAMNVPARHILGWDLVDRERVASEIAKIISPLSETEQELVLALAKEVAIRSQQK